MSADPLTPREFEVARLVTRGLSCKAIARRLSISTRTVQAHIQSAAARLPGDGPPKHRLTVFILQLEDAA